MSLLDILSDYSLLIFILFIALPIIFFGIRRQKWCPKCKKASMVEAGPVRVNRTKPMVCSKCNYSKTIYVGSNNSFDPPP